MGENKTISQVVKDGLCTGCGTCVALCPEKAIEMVIDEKKGIYVPELDEEKCNHCGICFKVCPGHEVDFKGLNLEIFGKDPEDVLIGNYLNCYVGHSTDYDIRYNSASGGLITQLLIFALEEGLIDGALVTRMKKNNPLEPEPFIARTKEEIIEARGSKYCPVPANIALEEILNSEEGEKFAVVGLPCHIQGARKAEQINKKLRDRIVLHIAVFCSGTPNFKATEFLLRGLKLKVEEVKTLKYRCEGWPGQMTLELRNGKTEHIPYPTYWDGFGNLFFPFRCKVCIDWFSKISDISFGDAWLPEMENDEIGESVILSRSIQCENILQQLLHKEKAELGHVNSDKVNESQKGFSRKRRDLKVRLTMSKLLGKEVSLYDDDCLQQPQFHVYLHSSLVYLLEFIASRRNIWWLLDIYCTILKCGRYFKSKLKLYG